MTLFYLAPWYGAEAAEAYLQRNAEGRYDLAGRQQTLGDVLQALAEFETFELITVGLPPSPIRRDYRDITAERLIDRLTEGLIVATEYLPATQGPRQLKKVVVYANVVGSGAGGGARPQRAANLSPADQSALISSALKGEQGIEIARQGMANLAQQDTPETALMLSEALESTDATIRREAILALATMRSEQALQILGQVLYGHEDAEERLLAAQQLQRHASPAAKTLLAAATEDSDPRVKALAEAAAKDQP